jgi:hypothetical protein
MAGWHQHYTTQLMIGPVYTLGKASSLGMSLEGCPYRGTLTCLRCEFAPVTECGYKCVIKTSGRGATSVDCEWRAVCKCGWDQTEQLRAWGLV